MPIPKFIDDDMSEPLLACARCFIVSRFENLGPLLLLPFLLAEKLFA